MADLSIQELKEFAPNLNEQVIQEAKDTFKQFDTDNESKIEGYDWVITMMMTMGCDLNKKQLKELYIKVFKSKPPSEIEIDLKQYIQMIDHYVAESDPVDGVISTIQEAYDENDTGNCTYDQLLSFLQEQNYFDADKEAVEKVVSDFKDANGNVDYAKAMKTVIQ